MSGGYEFTRTDWLALLFTFLSITMTFIIFSSITSPTVTCATGQFVNKIGTVNDGCASAMTGCNKPTSIIQCATLTCTIPQGGNSCGTTGAQNLFSPAFSQIPTYYECVVTSSPLVSSEQQTGFAVFHSLESSTTGNTWSNMPTTTTDLFGNGTSIYSANWIEVLPFRNFYQQAQFEVDVITPSISSIAHLKVQYTTDFGVTWIDWPGLDVPVNAVTPVAGGFNPGYTGVKPLPAGLTSLNTIVWLRVVGYNGAGLGDNPQFGMIAIDFTISSFTSISGTTSAITASAMSCKASATTPLASPFTVIFNRIAIP